MNLFGLQSSLAVCIAGPFRPTYAICWLKEAFAMPSDIPNGEITNSTPYSTAADTDFDLIPSGGRDLMEMFHFGCLLMEVCQFAAP